MDSGLQEYVPDWLRGLIGAQAPFVGPREPRIGVDPHPRPIDQLSNDIAEGGRGIGNVLRGEMPLSPGAGVNGLGNGLETAVAGVGKAAKDVGGSAVKGLQTAAEKAGRSISDGRWAELLGKYGGKGQ